MVKSRPREVRLELIDEVNLLASQFVKTVGLGGDGVQARRSNDEQMINWSSTSPSQPLAGPDADSITSATHAEGQAGVLLSPLKYSTLGFDVDLTGSEMSDMPFLRPKVETLMMKTRPPKYFRPMLGIREDVDKPRSKIRAALKESQLKVKEDRFKRRRAERLSTGFVVNRLVHSARQRLLTDLSLMVPGSIEQIKSLDPSGNGELVWGVVQSWLEGQPDLTAQMNLTTEALNLIATYVGPTLEARSLQALKLYAGVVCKLDAETYKDLCSFLFPEDNRFSSEGVC